MTGFVLGQDNKCGEITPVCTLQPVPSILSRVGGGGGLEAVGCVER